MKLAEALRIRADLDKKIRNLKERMKVSVRIQEGDTPPESMPDLMTQLDHCLNELEVLIYRINQTNMMTLYQGETLTKMMARRDVLNMRLKAFKEVLEYTTNERYARYDIKLIRTINVPDYQKQYDKYAKDLRELDLKIQELNWTTDLL